MNIYEAIFGYVTLILTLIFLSFIGYWAVFRANSMIRFYLKCHQKYYLNSLKKHFLLIKYYQAFTKSQYDFSKRQSQNKWFYYNLKICGVCCILFALLPLLISIHDIFKVNLGIFSNN
jgi:hypothetical protein